MKFAPISFLFLACSALLLATACRTSSHSNVKVIEGSPAGGLAKVTSWGVTPEFAKYFFLKTNWQLCFGRFKTTSEDEFGIWLAKDQDGKCKDSMVPRSEITKLFSETNSSRWVRYYETLRRFSKDSIGTVSLIYLEKGNIQLGFALWRGGKYPELAKLCTPDPLYSEQVPGTDLILLKGVYRANVNEPLDAAFFKSGPADKKDYDVIEFCDLKVSDKGELTIKPKT